MQPCNNKEKEKQCSSCKKLKKFKRFSIDHSRRGQLSIICKSCNKRNIASSREKVNAQSHYKMPDMAMGFEEQLAEVYQRVVCMERLRKSIVQAFTELGASEQFAERITSRLVLQDQATDPPHQRAQ